MKVYVAARTSDRKEVKNLNKLLQQKGFEVSDWTWHKNTKPYTKHKKLSKDYSVEDIKNILNSDVFILLTNKTPGFGSTTELGVALASFELTKKPIIYVVGQHIETNMFYFHPAVNLRKSIKELLKEI